MKIEKGLWHGLLFLNEKEMCRSGKTPRESLEILVKVFEHQNKTPDTHIVHLIFPFFNFLLQ